MVIGPRIIRSTLSALPAPLAIRITASALRIVPMPIVSASRGTRAIVSTEQRRVGPARGLEQRDAMSTGDQRVRGLVEPDVTVHTNAQQLKSNTARVIDRGFVPLAFGVGIIGRAVQRVKLVCRDIHTCRASAR